MMTKKTRD